MNKPQVTEMQDFAGFNTRPDAKLWIFKTKTAAIETDADVWPTAYVFGYTWFEARSGAMTAFHSTLDGLTGEEVEKPSQVMLEAGSTVVFVDRRGGFQIVETARDMSGEEVRTFNPDLLPEPPEPAPSQSEVLHELQERYESNQEEPIKSAAVSVIERTIEGSTKLLCVWNQRYKGWSLPGGLVEPDETPRDAQERELREETDLVTASSIPVFIGPHGGKVIPGRASIVHVFLVIAAGEPVQMEEGCPLTWLTPDEFTKQSPFGEFYAKLFADPNWRLRRPFTAKEPTVKEGHRLQTNGFSNPVDKLVSIKSVSSQSYSVSVAGYPCEGIYSTKEDAEAVATKIGENIQAAHAPELTAQYMRGCADMNVKHGPALKDEYLRACNDIKDTVHNLSRAAFRGLDPSAFLDMLLNNIKSIASRREQ